MGSAKERRCSWQVQGSALADGFSQVVQEGLALVGRLLREEKRKRAESQKKSCACRSGSGVGQFVFGAIADRCQNLRNFERRHRALWSGPRLCQFALTNVESPTDSTMTASNNDLQLAPIPLGSLVRCAHRWNPARCPGFERRLAFRACLKDCHYRCSYVTG